MNRPTIALACILKNEVNNLPQLLESVKGCFDEIHLTDTGSTDGSIELIKGYEWANPANTPVFLHQFEWCDDFAAARNASFSYPQTDYIMWMDLDDVLSSAESFIAWRDTVMGLADFWLATYHYSLSNGKPNCSFARERVLKREAGFKWNYFVHEGVNPNTATKKNIQGQYAATWSVIHKRTDEDAKKDKSRNLLLFEKNKHRLDARMRYYLGKELFENQKPLEAFPQLIDAVALPELEAHDRIMGLQYACLCAMQLNQFERAIQLAHQGLQLAPTRAEFCIVIADSYLKLGRMTEAIPYYKAATGCAFNGEAPIQGALFAHEDSYKHYPLNQIARIYANLGDMDRAERYTQEALALGENVESNGIKKEIAAIREKANIAITKAKKDTDHVVITCYPTGFYEWDEEIYKTRGIGGSETAAVEMASHIARLTDREVLIFNNRDAVKRFGKVSYLPAKDAPKYFEEHKPYRHIAWRHNIKFTEAPTYLWCHDLGIPGIEHHQNYEKVFALSEFHKKYIVGMYGVPEHKIWVTSNGIDPMRFVGPKVKEPGKIVFSSSPDRGLDRALEVMDMVVRDYPQAKLHVYYGFENLYKNGRGEDAKRLESLMRSKPYTVYHGNISQTQLTKELASACVWLYPTNFLETYCITAVEMLCSKVWPVVRAWGALPDTLRNQKAFLLNSESAEPFACDVMQVLKGQMWEQIDVNPEDFSWEKVAKSWIEFLSL